MAPQACAVDADDLFIPIIDFSLFLNGTPTQKSAAARSILAGFQSAGFIYLITAAFKTLPAALDHHKVDPLLQNHSIPLETVAHTFASSAEFFARPQEQKDALGWTTPEANRGYVSHGREKVSILTDKAAVEAAKAAAPDLKESLEIGREGVAGLPNHWPSGDAPFKETMLHFHDRAKQLHVSVMRAIAVGMGLDEAWFDGYTDHGDNTLRLLHYPPAPKALFAGNALQVRAGEHTDYGSITLLFQDARGGLQVKSPTGTFVDVPAVEGSVVVNAGDLLARWSNDTIKSTLHRVVEPPAPEEGEMHPARYSIAYFCNPNFVREIEAIEGTYGGEKGEKKYDGINSGEYLVQRLAATY